MFKIKLYSKDGNFTILQDRRVNEWFLENLDLDINNIFVSNIKDVIFNNIEDLNLFKLQFQDEFQIEVANA